MENPPVAHGHAARVPSTAIENGVGQRWPHDVGHHPDVLASLLQQRPLQGRQTRSREGSLHASPRSQNQHRHVTQGCVPAQQMLLSLGALQLPAPGPAAKHRLWHVLLASLAGGRPSAPGTQPDLALSPAASPPYGQQRQSHTPGRTSNTSGSVTLHSVTHGLGLSAASRSRDACWWQTAVQGF